MKSLVLGIGTLIALVLVACGSDQPATENTTSQSPTARAAEAAQPTVKPTATRVPTPAPTRRPNTATQLGPTPTPVDVIPPTLPPDLEFQFADILGLTPEQWQLNGYGAIKPLPPKLEQTSEPLGTEEVIEGWTDLLSDTRLIVNGSPVHLTGAVNELGDFDFLFCAAGYGAVMVLPPALEQHGVGSLFRWRVEHSPASPWWSPTLVFELFEPTFIPAYPAMFRTYQDVFRRPVSIIGNEAWIDGFLFTELELSILTMADPTEFCSDEVPAGG